MFRFRDSHDFRKFALRAAGIALIVLISTIALTMACTLEQDDVTATTLLAPLAPPRVVAHVLAAAPQPPLSLPLPPAYQPPRNA